MCISLQTASCSENCTAQYCESQWAAAVSGKKISWNFGLFCQEYCSSYFRKDIKNPWSRFSLKFVNKVWFYKVECSLGILPFWSVWDHCLIFTKIQFRVKGGEDRRRTCTVQETAFFSPNIVFIKTCWVTVQYAQAMLPKTLFNMLVKRMNFKQYTD